jgi:ribonuclease HI
LAQKAKLITHTQALELRKGKKKKNLNIYTDSRYAFATVHVHEDMYQQKGLLKSGGRK